MMRATVVDIARAVGVSRTTVSNVMNGRAKCSVEVRERVLQAARELGYTRNMAAKTLVERRSDLIGLVLPSYIDEQLLTKSPFYNLVIDAVNATLRTDALYDLIINCVSSAERSDAIREWAMLRSLDGLIVVGDFPEDALRPLAESRLPMVFIDSYRSSLETPILVNIDDEAGGYKAARHLLDRGYERITICTSDIANSAVNQRRRSGFQRALQEAGLASRHIEAANNFFEGGLAIADVILDSGSDAVFAVSDAMAAGIVKRLVGRGVRIPEDFGVIGFDNLDICEQMVPELTTIDQDIFGKGKAAVTLLMRAIRGEESERRLVMPTRLIQRKTT